MSQLDHAYSDVLMDFAKGMRKIIYELEALIENPRFDDTTEEEATEEVAPKRETVPDPKMEPEKKRARKEL